MSRRKTRGLRFDPATHRYWLQKVPVPNVSSVVLSSGVAATFDDVPEDVLEVARLRGTHVHLLIQFYLEGDLDPASVHPALAGYFRAAREAIASLGVSPVSPPAVEARLGSTRYGFAGTPDLVGFITAARLPQRAGIDWKSGLLDRAGVELQMAGYDILWHENYPSEPWQARFGVQLRPNGRWKLVELGHPDARTMFLYALELHREPDGPRAPAYRDALDRWRHGLR